MSHVQITEKQYLKILEELEYLRLDKSYRGGINAIREDILDDEMYTNDTFIIKDRESGNYCTILIKEGQVINVKFRAGTARDLDRFNISNDRLWPYFRRR